MADSVCEKGEPPLRSRIRSDELLWYTGVL